MTSESRISLKTLYNLGIFLMFLALFLVGGASLSSLNTAIKMSNAIVERSLSEIHHTMGLRLALSQAAMPVNDHVIHANPLEQENYQQLNTMVERHFDAMAKSVHLDAFQRELLDQARDNWIQAKQAGDAIMKIKDPVGNPEAARQMEQFDRIIDDAINILSDLYKSIYQETTVSHDKLHDIESRALALVVVLSVLALILVVFGSILLAKSFFPPLRRMLAGVHLFGEGHLEHRIDHDMPREFEELADGINSMAGKLEQIHMELKDAAIHDLLTGCFNRRQMDMDIIKLFSQSRRTGEPLSLLMLDLDLFKRVNDLYGHIAGDEVLRSFARVVSNQLRQYETLYRYGGEEFVIILPAAEEAGAGRLAERIRASVAEKMIDVGGEKPIQVTVSIGIASYPRSATSVRDIIEKADQALYAAKEEGRNRVHVYDGAET